MSKLSAKLSFKVLQCDCCGRINLKRTVEIKIEGSTINLGVICCSLWFDLNMSGNPFGAAKRLSNKAKHYSEEDISEIYESILDASSSWKKQI